MNVRTVVKKTLSVGCSCYVGCVFPPAPHSTGPVWCPDLWAAGSHPLPGGLQEQTQALHGQEDGPLLLLLGEIKVRRLESKSLSHCDSGTAVAGLEYHPPAK